jgi:hypothetical protein
VNKKSARKKRQHRYKQADRNARTQDAFAAFAKFARAIKIEYFDEDQLKLLAKNPPEENCLFCGERIAFEDFREKEFVGFKSVRNYFAHKKHFYEPDGRPRADQNMRVRKMTDRISEDRLESHFRNEPFLDDFLFKYFPFAKKTEESRV